MKEAKFVQKSFSLQPAKTIWNLLLFSILFTVFSGFASEKQRGNLTFNFNNSNIEKVIDYIETNSNFRFLYRSSEIDLTKKINLNYTGEITEAISILFKNTPIKPIITNKQVILKTKIIDQQRVISGIVKDREGIPLEGVTVLINQFERGTATDANGKYSISAKTGDKILFSYVGFKNQEFIIGEQNTINVTLQFDISLLDEIVLIGYGKKERSKISTAIGTIEGQDIENEIQSGASFDRSLSGLVKGVRIIQGSGRPGTGVDINIRGYTSPFADSANNPLFIIDGVPIQAKVGFGANNNPLASINPNDIESINVLKDAAATSIYGSRGANGVIIIKTKKGHLDKDMTVQLSVRSTFSKPINTLKYLDANGYKNYVSSLMNSGIIDRVNSLDPSSDEFAELGNNLFALTELGVGFNPDNGKFNYDPSLAEYGDANINWADVVYRDAAYTQEYNASLNGGTEQTTYGLSLRYLDQEGLLKADNYRQYNARLNFSIIPNDKWEIGTNIGLNSTKNKTGYISMNQDLNRLFSARPDLPVYNEKGEINTTKATAFSFIANPLGITTKNYGESNGKSVTGNIYVQYEILKDLKLKGAVNIAHFTSNTNNFTSGKYGSVGFINGIIQSLRRLNLSTAENTNIVSDLTANYTKSFNEKHTIDFLAGITRTEEYIKTTQNNYFGFPNDNLRFPQFATSTEGKPNVTANPPNKLNSYITRASYDYDNKYGITATIRLDQATNFAPGNRDAWFPSVAASWNIHNEKFVTNKDKINNLRLRLSYGNTGSTNVPSFSFIQKFTAETLYNGQTAVGPSNTLSNPYVKWEKTAEINAGIDFGFFKNRISGSFDIYRRKSSDVLAAAPYPLSTGATSFIGNLADIENKGFEVALNFDIIRNENFNWSFGANATKNINKVLAFNVASVDESFNDTYQVGKEINLIKGYVVEGIYQTPKEIADLNAKAVKKGYAFYDENIAPGDYKMKDLNNDGRITSEDRKILGSSQPDLFGGFRTKLNYKGLSLGLSFSYSFGSEILRSSNALSNASPLSNIETQFAPENRWSPTNEKATLPRIAFNTGHNARSSTANIFDASFVRFKSIRLGYNLPYSLAEKLKLSNIDLYISGNNLHTWTDFPGLDPEGTTGGAFPTSTTNRDPYPISKSFTFGVNATF